jgi:DNA-binding HxlR family transcriptional regulator
MKLTSAYPELGPPDSTSCRGRAVLDKVGDKWSLHVLTVLGDRTMRFGELRREIEGISQRMLTATLRTLERDGIVNRTLYPEIPPRTEYALTPLGKTLLEAVSTFVRWAEEHVDTIDAARAEYDSRTAAEAGVPAGARA